MKEQKITIKEAKAEHAKWIKKRIKELEKFMYNPEYDERSFYSSGYTSEWHNLPKVAQSAIQNELHNLERELKNLETTTDDIYNTIITTMDKIYKFYGIYDIKHEVLNHFSANTAGRDFEEYVMNLSNSIHRKMETKGRY